MRSETQRASLVPILVAVVYVALQIAVPLVRLQPAHPFPWGARFTWSMFATPIGGTCSHTIEWRDGAGRLESFPLPAEGPARALFAARSVDEFRRVATLLGWYQDDDASLAHALDHVLVRYRNVIDVHHTHTLVSTLDCHSAESAPFRRVLRLEAQR